MKLAKSSFSPSTFFPKHMRMKVSLRLDTSCTLSFNVHAIKRHRSPLYDSLTPQQMAEQEAEADELGLQWFNDHIEAIANPCLPPLTREEIEEAKSESRALMDKLYAD